jgi:hypothetical protein
MVKTLVESRARRRRGTRGRETTMGNRVLGILVFVGILVVVNVLSYLLDWGFWLY